MSARAKITASQWWHMVRAEFVSVREFIQRAQKADLAETGHECGHEFEVTVRSKGHFVGDEHGDADWWDTSGPVTVRAHDLPTALLIAATRPLADWFPSEATEDRQDS